MSIAIKLEPKIEEKLAVLSARAGKTKADYLHDAVIPGRWANLRPARYEAVGSSVSEITAPPGSASASASA